MSDPVHQVLDETRDTREYKRALAVTMAHQGIAYDTITTVLLVSISLQCRPKATQVVWRLCLLIWTNDAVVGL
jgi:hypothetical protein